MQFLNDKFFKTAVILFFLLMALPFMFSEPEPEKKDNTPALEFEDSSPVYKIINKIAKFYGLKKENNKEFALNNKQIATIKKQLTEKKENKNNQEKSINTEEKSAADSAKNAQNTALPETKSTPNYTEQKNNTYTHLANQNYEVLTSDKNYTEAKNNTETDIKNFAVLPKNNQKNTYKNTLQETNKAVKTDISNTPKTTKEIIAKQNTLATPKNTSQAQSYKTYKTEKGAFSTYFKASTQVGKDFLNHIDNSINNIQLIRQNKTDTNQEQEKPAPPYTKTYRTQILNPATKKTEVILAQKPITQDNAKEAALIKKITADSMVNKDYNGKTFKLKNGQEALFPSKDETAILIPKVPPHILFPLLNEETKLNKDFEISYNKALNLLPSKAAEYPILEFVYQNKNNEVMRAPNDSFNVIAISRILADKIALPVEQKNIDFLDTKRRIYVVPEEQLYQKYLSQNIPVIYYPDLSPENLGSVYETANTAIETLNFNIKTQLKDQEKQNKSEIEQLLKENK